LASPSKDVGRIHGHVTESKDIYGFDVRQRGNAKGILSPDNIGENVAVGELFTTLGGKPRVITTEDLKQFRNRIGQLKRRSTLQKMKGGIRVAQIIKLSDKSPNMFGGVAEYGDIERSNAQIKKAVPASSNKGLMRFITNAGGTTPNVTRHHVNIRFMSYGQAVSMPADKPNSRKIAKWLANEPIRFECDCGRHKYWFRYIAGVGGWGEGRIETGFPKIRNPKLMGVACKHVLRVARELMTSRNVHNHIDKMIRSDKGMTRTKQAEAKKLQKSQKIPKLIDPKKAHEFNKKLHGAIKKSMKKHTPKKQEISDARRELDRLLKDGRIDEKFYKTMTSALKRN